MGQHGDMEQHKRTTLLQRYLESNQGEKHMTKRETIVTFIKDMLRPRTLKEIIDIELRDAYLSKMQAEKSLQYAQSLVEYNRQRIRVLEEKLKELNDA